MCELESLVVLYLVPRQLDGRKYLIFLEMDLPTFLSTVTAHIYQGKGFQHNGAPANSKIVLRDCLNRKFGARWIGKGGPITWRPRSSYLSPLDLFRGREMPLPCVKSLVKPRFKLTTQQKQRQPRVCDKSHYAKVIWEDEGLSVTSMSVELGTTYNIILRVLKAFLTVLTTALSLNNSHPRAITTVDDRCTALHARRSLYRKK
ncbi:hypothetical protein TNCV_828941 [Trichonephila clavipes]|nr:hypothetical protein TNCV_828941 [Trichonephila clavipes]